MTATDLENNPGVYYRPQDSPGFFIRLLMDGIDLAVVLLIFAFGSAAVISITEHESWQRRIAALAILVLIWVYLVPMKRSAVGTLGYSVFGYKVADLQGMRPGLLRMTLRTLSTVAFNPAVDLVYLTSDPHRQALRDKLSGTYVIKRKASPIGRGEIGYSRAFFFGYSLIFREVKRRAA